MRIGIVLVVLLGLLPAVSWGDDPDLVSLGRRVGPVAIGMSIQDVIHVMGNPQSSRSGRDRARRSHVALK